MKIIKGYSFVDIPREFESGDKVVYSYIHHLNSTSTTRITKYGTFMRYVNHTLGYKGEKKAEVLFLPNSRATAVPISKLKKIEKGVKMTEKEKKL